MAHVQSKIKATRWKRSLMPCLLPTPGLGPQAPTSQTGPVLQGNILSASCGGPQNDHMWLNQWHPQSLHPLPTEQAARARQLRSQGLGSSWTQAQLKGKELLLKLNFVRQAARSL